MLKLVVAGDELYNEETQEFFSTNEFVLEFEHSLLSLSKWESKYQKPFLSQEKKTTEEVIGYVESMLLSDINFSDILPFLTKEHYSKINDYIDSSESATTFGDALGKKPRGRSEIITSELIYFWMVSFTIPFEAEKWHLNRLLALIQICNIKNSKQKKMPRNEIAARNRALNEQRKAQLNTNG